MGRTTDTPAKLQAALCDLMWQNSYGRVTIDAICERAGVKKGSFYHAYPDKASLAIEAFQYFWDTHSRPWMDAAFSPSENPLTRISHWLAGGLEKAIECQRVHGRIHGCPLYNVGTEISTLEPAVAEKVTEILRLYRRYITTTLRDAVAENILVLDDADEVARDVLTMVEGALTQARISNSVDPLRRLPVSVGRLIGTTLPISTTLTN
ncbi:TetR/AcrR family transcriptional regulator [Verrucomicrobiaceae bacterium 227]